VGFFIHFLITSYNRLHFLVIENIKIDYIKTFKIIYDKKLCTVIQWPENYNSLKSTTKRRSSTAFEQSLFRIPFLYMVSLH
jgi:hypothetical protein